MSWYGEQLRNTEGGQLKQISHRPYTRAQQMTMNLIVPEMKNISDCQVVTNAIKRLPGVVNATAILNRRQLQVTYNISRTTLENISYQLKATGYGIISKA
jgi:hypothetical protein